MNITFKMFCGYSRLSTKMLLKTGAGRENSPYVVLTHAAVYYKW